MKKAYMPAVAFLLLLATGSCSKIKGREAIIVRNCTGTYLHVEGKEYRVCNIMTTNDYSEGSRVKAAFYQVDSCQSEELIICQMVYPCDGVVKVISIEQE